MIPISHFHSLRAHHKNGQRGNFIAPAALAPLAVGLLVASAQGQLVKIARTEPVHP